MRWLTRRFWPSRLQSERGASAVLVGLLIVPIIGCVAIALDVGAIYAERAQLQNGADAAALAIAQACSKDDGVCAGSAALAQQYASANANDQAANVSSVTFPNAHTVVVTVSTREPDGGSAIRHPFASLIGHDSTTVGASATAEWGPPGAGPVLPLALSFCEFQASVPMVPGTLMSIRTDTNKKCKKDPGGADIPGGFGWIDQTPGKCEAYVKLNPLGELWLGNDPGNSVPNLCSAKLDVVKNTTILIPIYDASRGSGQNGEYRIYAFAAFRITGWIFSNDRDEDSAAPPCGGGNARCLQGYFDKWVSVDSVFDVGGPKLNGSIVRLIN